MRKFVIRFCLPARRFPALAAGGPHRRKATIGRSAAKRTPIVGRQVAAIAFRRQRPVNVERPQYGGNRPNFERPQSSVVSGSADRTSRSGVSPAARQRRRALENALCSAARRDLAVNGAAARSARRRDVALDDRSAARPAGQHG